MRSWHCWSIVAVVAVLATCAPSGVPATAQPASDEFGVDLASTHDPEGSPADPSAVAAAGAAWVRVTADWPQLEPTRGTYAWAALDDQIRRATAAGERVAVLIKDTPRWAAPEPTAPESVWRHQPPRRIADWTAFVAAAAERYRGKVSAWQIEPAIGLSTYRGTPEDYRAMLHVAREEVRRADPRALLVAASPSGIDLPFIKAMLASDSDDFDAIMLYPQGRTPEDVLEALGAIRSRVLTDAHHQIWLSALPEWGAEPRLAVAALAGGVSREFWPRLDSSLATVLRLVGAARFVGPLDRGPGVVALVFTNGASPVAVLWSLGAIHTVSLATAGSPNAVGATGQAVSPGAGSMFPVGPDPVFVSDPAPSVVAEAEQAARQGTSWAVRDARHDFSHAASVSAQLGATDVEHGLYNQRLRSLRAGDVVPVEVDGVQAVRTDQSRDAVYVFFDVDHSYVYFVDGRYDLIVTVQVHRASAPQQVGFNLFYDSMSGYRFTPWQWVDAGQGWATYTFRLTDADFSSTWGWDFAVNGAGDKKENLIVRAVTVTKVPPGATP
jgi:hypothetical protein